MKQFKKIINKLAIILPSLALVVGIFAARKPCVIAFYQPETPSAFDKYR